MHWRDRQGRRPAMNEAGHAHELTFTCFHGHPFLQVGRTCQWLADAIDRARRDCDFQLWAYVFMPEHVHLLIYANQPDYDVSVILKAIKQPVAQRAMNYLRRHAPPMAGADNGQVWPTQRAAFLAGGQWL